MSDATPTLAELILAGARQVLGTIWTAMIYKVVAFDSATQTAELEPVLRSGVNVNAPVAFLGSGAIQHAVIAGDTGLLIPLTLDHADWLETGGDGVATTRRNALSQGVFIPLTLTGITAPVAGISIVNDVVSLGTQGATSAAAKSDVLLTYLSTLKTWLDTHTHASTGAVPAISSPTVPTSTLPASKVFVS